MVLLLSFGQSPEFFSGSVVCDSACVFVVGDGWDAEDGQVRYVWIDLSAVLGACVIVVLTTAAQDFTGWEAALVVVSLWAFGKEHPFSARICCTFFSKTQLGHSLLKAVCDPPQFMHLSGLEHRSSVWLCTFCTNLRNLTQFYCVAKPLAFEATNRVTNVNIQFWFP